MTTDKSEQHFAMESLRYIHSQMHSWGSRSISWVRPIQFCHLTHYSLKPLPQLNFQKDGLRNSMDPFPSEPMIKNKNNHLKSLRIILRAYSKWRTLIQKNHLNLSSDSESLRWATVQPLLFPLNVSEKEALPHDNGTWNTRPPHSSLPVRGRGWPPGFLIHPASCCRNPVPGKRGWEAWGSLPPPAPTYRADVLPEVWQAWAPLSQLTWRAEAPHWERQTETRGDHRATARQAEYPSRRSRPVSTPAPEHLPREKGRLWSSPQKN